MGLAFAACFGRLVAPVFALVAGSNTLDETPVMRGRIVAVCGLLSRADFPRQEGAVGLDIAVELASAIGLGWQEFWTK